MSDYMTRCRSWTTTAAVIALGWALAACAPTSASSTLTVPDVPGRALPASGMLEAASLETFQAMLAGQSGKPVVVNVWASWCGPCRVEAPLLQRAARRYEGRVAFLGVDSRDEQVAGERFLTRYRITYPNVFDSSGAIRGALELRGFPTTYIFGSDGRLRSRVVGGISEQVLAGRLDDALRQ